VGIANSGQYMIDAPQGAVVGIDRIQHANRVGITRPADAHLG